MLTAVRCSLVGGAIRQSAIQGCTIDKYLVIQGCTIDKYPVIHGCTIDKYPVIQGCTIDKYLGDTSKILGAGKVI